MAFLSKIKKSQWDQSKYRGRGDHCPHCLHQSLFSSLCDSSQLLFILVSPLPALNETFLTIMQTCQVRSGTDSCEVIFLGVDFVMLYVQWKPPNKFLTVIRARKRSQQGRGVIWIFQHDSPEKLWLAVGVANCWHFAPCYLRSPAADACCSKCRIT